MENKILPKLILSFFLFVVGTIAAIYISSFLHIFLSGGDLRPPVLSESIVLIFNSSQVRLIFLTLEAGVVLISIAFYILNDTFYKSELVKVTPNIKIPKSAGQMQFGSARFVTEEEKEAMFTVYKIDKSDKLIKQLLADGVKKESKVEDEQKDEEMLEEALKLPEPNLIEDQETNVIENTGEIIEFKYELQNQVNNFFKDCPEKLDYFIKGIKQIDSLLMVEREKKYTRLEEMMGSVLSDRVNVSAKAEFERYKTNISTDMFKEINALDDGEEKDIIANLYSELNTKFESEAKTYVKNLKDRISRIPKISKDTNLDEQYKIAESFKPQILVLPEGGERETLLGELSGIFTDIYDESDRRMEEIEELLRGVEV